MLRFYCILLFLFSMASNGGHGTWIASEPVTFELGSTVNSAIVTSSNSLNGTYMMMWPNLIGPGAVLYTTYTEEDGWNLPATIGRDVFAQGAVFSSCDPLSGKFLATWTDRTTGYPTYSVYTPGTGAESGWSQAQFISETSKAFADTANSYDSINRRCLVTWADSNNNQYPTYAFYDFVSETWGTIATLSITSRASNVYTCFNPMSEKFLATWTDQSNSWPMYCIYSSGVWGPVAYIEQIVSSANVCCSGNSNTGEFLATWVTYENSNTVPMYSFYEPNSGWSQSDPISSTSSSIDCFTAFDPVGGQYLASWIDVPYVDPPHYPTYSFYTPNIGWDSPTILSTSKIGTSNAFVSYNSNKEQFLVTWSNQSDAFKITYSFITNLTPRIRSIAPTSGPESGGTSVLLSGKNFAGATAVLFGGIPATGFTVHSPTSIEAISPPGSLVVDIQVITPYGTSPTSPDDLFSYIPAPVIQSISPSSGFEGGGTSVTITGENFINVTEVLFGIIPAASFTVESSSSIIAISPAGNGVVNIVVKTLGGSSQSSSSNQFTYTSTPPQTLIFPPRDVKGRRMFHQCAGHLFIVDTIMWHSPSRGEKPMLYKIFSDPLLRKLVGVVSGLDQTKFTFKNRHKWINQTNTYYLVSVSATGVLSRPVAIKIRRLWCSRCN